MEIVEVPKGRDSRCDNCLQIAAPLVRLDFRASYDDEECWICERCLRKALALISPEITIGRPQGEEQ